MHGPRSGAIPGPFVGLWRRRGSLGRPHYLAPGPRTGARWSSREARRTTRPAFLGLRDLVPRHRGEESPQGAVQALRPRLLASEMAEADDDEVVRRDDEGRLPPGSGHVVGLLGNREGPVPIQPEEAAVDGHPVRLPCGGDGAHEPYEALGQDPLPVPDPVLEVQVPKARP